MFHKWPRLSFIAASQVAPAKVLALIMLTLVANAGILTLSSLSMITSPKSHGSAQLAEVPQQTRIAHRFASSMGLVASQAGLIIQGYKHLSGPTRPGLAVPEVYRREPRTLDSIAYSPTITVTSTGGGTGGPDCKLRDAITAANTDTATGGCPAGNGDDIITLPTSATILLTEVDNGSGTPEATGLPQIMSNIIIFGNGTTIMGSGGFFGIPFRILRVAQTGALTLNSVVVSGGQAPSAYPLGPGGRGGDAGGIYNAGSLVLYASTVSRNASGDGSCDNGGDGGGIYNTGSLALINSTVSGNTTGSGLLAMACLIHVGPFYAGSGGGILNLGTVTVVNSTIADNSTGNSVFGSALDDSSHGGGGIANRGTMTLTHSTISGNKIAPSGLSTSGGGINNIAAQVANMQNAILAGNWSAHGGPDCAGTLTSGGYNLVGNSSDCTITAGTGDIVGTSSTPVNAQLWPLGDNGGPTQTMAFWPTSPARDRIPNAKGCGASIGTDQRGVPRPQPLGGLCDIGAFEYDRVDHFLPSIQKNQ